MKKSFLKKFIILFIVQIIFLQGFTAKAISKPDYGFVLDNANIISQDTIDHINEMNFKMKDYGSQVAVLTVNDLSGTDIESFSNKVFRDWGIGDKKKNNGVLLLVSLNDRQVRFEVGYGLEGAINDAKAGRIIRNVIKPNFQAEDYDKGIRDAFDSVIYYIGEEYNVKFEDIDVNELGLENDLSISPAMIILIIFLFIVITSRLNRYRYLYGRRGNMYRRRRRNIFFDDNDPFGGFFGGSGGSGGFGGFGGSGGGSFGGGSSGGGGASGSW